jgi:hypothetical protein
MTTSEWRIDKRGLGGYKIRTEQGLPMSAFFMPGMTRRILLKTVRQCILKPVNVIAYPVTDWHEWRVPLMHYLQRNSAMGTVLVEDRRQTCYQNQQ